MILLSVFFLLFGHIYCGGPDEITVTVTGPPCKGKSSEVIPHPKDCQLYYDCRLQAQPYEWLEKNLVECPYPLLFDTTTNACEFFTKVDCGARTEPINACEYINNQCHGSHCRPCYYDYPECKGLPDGPNPIPYKQNSPFFAICYKGRLVKEESCPPEDTGKPRIYDSNSNQCVKMP